MTVVPAEEDLRKHRIKRPDHTKSAWPRERVAWLKELAAGTTMSVSLRTALSSYVRELELVQAVVKAPNGKELPRRFPQRARQIYTVALWKTVERRDRFALG
jgi:hypothetical protein